jgi:hypothetical protein
LYDVNKRGQKEEWSPSLERTEGLTNGAQRIFKTVK